MPGTYGYQQIFTESVSNVTATNSVALGTRRVEGGVEYVYVFNAGTTAAVGYGVIASANSGYTVTVSAALGDSCFGVVREADLTTNYYGWVAVKGKCNILIGSDHKTAAVGNGLYLIANGSFGVIQTGATGMTWAGGKAGIALDTTGTAQTGAAYMSCIG